MVCSRAGIAAVLLAAGAASAQPVEQPCRVVVAVAPDDVRAEIEAWVRAEPRCVRELEVRVVPTEDGLYLSATDSRGRVRERVVPDAQSAAVLVVSWMADDSLGRPPHAVIEPATEVTPTSVEDPEIPGAPGLVRFAQRHGSERGRRWLTFGAIGSSDERGGMRASIDLFAGKTLSLGVAGGWQRGQHDEEGTGQARVVLGATHAIGPVTLRAHLGFGVDAEKADDRMDRDQMERSTAERTPPRVTPAIEAGILAKVRLTDTWGLVGGPLVSATREAHPDLSLFLGVQYGL